MQTPEQLAALADEMRILILDMITEAKSGHPGGSLSSIDLITALWFSEMQGVDPQNLSPDRDRFILSKGHAVPALYAVLAKKGFFPIEELKTLRRTGSRIQGHPDRVRMPILEASTGSLGQGLSVAQGLALGFKMDGKSSRVFCLLGDGEIQEGQIWEAAMSAPKFGLSNLCAILDANGGQIDGPTEEVMPLEPLADKWEAFGWNVIEINGHDMTEILAALRTKSDSPTLILARTVKGKGVSFMEGKAEWHGSAPKPEQFEKAKAEIIARRK
ncbi:transketolase [Bdellovibrionota bacterium FG-2]